jgi:predicted alpha/beta hydrolase family esterase
MKKVFIVHRWSGEPETDWYPWVKAELEKKGHEVIVPAMKGTDEPDIDTWVGHLANVVGEVDSDTYFIGHSIGCQTIMRFLESQEETAGGAVFVAGWFKLENLEDEETEAVAKPWMEIPIDFKRLKKVLPKSTLIISDNDPYGAFEFNKKRFTELGSKILVLHKAGHITGYNGFSKLPEAIKEISDFN